MIITTASIAWSFLQITVLFSFSLAVAWLLRGRRPQFVTAMLAGACVASLVLASIAVVPSCQWSLVSEQIIHSEPKAIVAVEADVHCESSSLSQDEVEIRKKRGEEIGANETSIFTQKSGFETLQQFVLQYLQRVDHNVREVEVWQRPIATARNVSLLLFVTIGLAAMSLLWCFSWLYMRKILQCSIPVEDQELLNLVSVLATSFGLKRTLTVRESSLVPIGATVGWRRVTVLLQSDWRTWSLEERKAVIAHELAHAIRHDFVWVIISSWTQNLLFFHPMVHALIHRMRLEQELAADQLAAGKVGNARAYGRALASLALRSQRIDGSSSARFGSMLSAGQICVTRRIIMLKQGSLRPIQTRSRWSTWAVAAIACTAIPLAGLRGTTQEPVVDKPVNKSPLEKDAADATKPKPLSKEFLAAYPPLEFKGATVYRPGRFRSGEFGPEAAWINDLFSISMLGQPFPDKATVYGDAHNVISWTDEGREHGRSSLGLSFREAEATNPGQLTRFFRLPFEFANRQFRVTKTETFDGRNISGVTNSLTEDAPEKWLIDDELGYFLGTLDEAKQYIRGQRFALESIPENFREDFQNAAFGIVFSDCNTWPGKIETFFKGAPMNEKFQVFGWQPAAAIIKDVSQIGLFVDGCKSPACSVLAVTKDARAAKRLANQIRTLVELGKVALSSVSMEGSGPEMEPAKSILDTLEIIETGAEVRAQFDIFVPSVSQELVKANSKLLGWIDINSYVTAEANGTVSCNASDMVVSFPSLVGQTLDAANYRGKTVELVLDVQCKEDEANRTGAFIWTSKKETIDKTTLAGRTPRQQDSTFSGHRVLVAKTLAANGASAFSESLEMARHDGKTLLPEDAPFRTLKVQVTVPAKAEHLSFGFYNKNSQVRVRNVKLLTNENNQSSKPTGIDATADVPYNILVMPGYKIGSEPTNLNFESLASETVRQAARPDHAETSKK
jgi:beta-lactamase regulating signal transducer with metallopeptidase domain